VRTLTWISIAVTLLWLQPARSAPEAPLDAGESIPLQGVGGRIDHFGVDVTNQRLFIAALGNDTVEAIDLKANKRLKSLAGFGEPQGVLGLPQFNRVYVANGSADRVDVLDASSLERVKSLAGLSDADNVRYDAEAKQVYVGYGRGALKILDAATGEAIGDIPLPGHPESFQLERKGSRIFVNVPNSKQIAVVDRVKRSVVASWDVPVSANFPMALDESNRRLFVGARYPATLLVYDIDNGNIVAQLKIGGDTDDLFYDSARKRVYVVCGEGVIDVIQQQDADHYAPLGRLRTAPRARTGLWVPELSTLYVAVPATVGSSARLLSYRPR
jgi:DNA-binding beta-propeller fold protein YncE